LASEHTLTEHRAAAREIYTWPVRVYYEDTDGGGVVYYANYLRFMERARTEWLRSLGFEQGELARRAGVLFVVRSVAIEYLRPSLYDDSLQITVEPAKVGAGSIELAQRVLRGDEVLVTATVRVVCVDAGSFRATRMPQHLGTTIRMAL
jgi:acyl-CoA thioester hydrolase